MILNEVTCIYDINCEQNLLGLLPSLKKYRFWLCYRRKTWSSYEILSYCWIEIHVISCSATQYCIAKGFGNKIKPHAHVIYVSLHKIIFVSGWNTDPSTATVFIEVLVLIIVNSNNSLILTTLLLPLMLMLMLMMMMMMMNRWILSFNPNHCDCSLHTLQAGFQWFERVVVWWCPWQQFHDV